MFLNTVCSDKLKRNYMEDNYYINNEKKYFSISDGHSGNLVSNYISCNFFKELEDKIKTVKQEKKQDNDIKKFFVDLCKEIDFKIYNIVKQFNKKDISGSTFSSVFLINNCLYFLNIGDSITALISENKIKYLNSIHKPENEDEKKRIEKHYPVINNRIDGKLNISRTFGDFIYKNFDDYYNSSVIAEPELHCVKLNELKNKNSWLLLASDGLYEKYSIELIIYAIDYLIILGFDIKLISNLILNQFKFVNVYDNLTFIIILIEPIIENEYEKTFFMELIKQHKTQIKKNIKKNQDNNSINDYFLNYVISLDLNNVLKFILILLRDYILNN